MGVDQDLRVGYHIIEECLKSKPWVCIRISSTMPHNRRMFEE